MKKKSAQIAFDFLLFCVLIGGVHASEPNERSSVLVSATREKHETHTLGKCKFLIGRMMGGGFRSVDGAYSMGNVWMRNLPDIFDFNIPLDCHDRNDQERLEIVLGAKQINGNWQPAGGYEYGCDRQKWSKFRVCEDVHNLPFAPEQHMRAISLSGSNWQGIGILIDDTTGEERTRQREFRYCLYHAQVALCGRTFVRNLMKPHNDVLPTVLTVLNSIDFVDDVPMDPLATPSR